MCHANLLRWKNLILITSELCEFGQPQTITHVQKNTTLDSSLQSFHQVDEGTVTLASVCYANCSLSRLVGGRHAMQCICVVQPRWALAYMVCIRLSGFDCKGLLASDFSSKPQGQLIMRSDIGSP